jgi:2-oxoglutarate ferredoxin oxidoreductase subunit beta
MEGLGTTFIEVASNGPSNWKLTPQESLKWLEEKVFPYYPLGVFKDVKKQKKEE